MKFNKAENTRRNVVFGVILKLYQILLPFVFRTIMVYTLGVQYLGVNSLFTSILQVLNLAELGVGSAMVFSMYKPIADEDEKKICALMQLYRLYYTVVGAVILVIGLIITPFIPKLINGEVPAGLNLYILYYLNLGATVLTYWMLAYKSSILQAYQRQDVISKVTIVTDTVKYLLQLVALVVFYDYYYYVIAILLSQVLCNVVTAFVADKMYPQYKPMGKLAKEETTVINQRIKDLFTSKLGGVIVNSADTIVISAFLGLTELAIYQNYFYIMNAVMAFIMILNNSVLAGIGNSMITKSMKENFKDFRVFLFIEMWIFSVCVCCFSSLFQPFMVVWMGKDLLLDYKIVILLCIYFVGYEYVMLMSVYKDAAGIWHEDRYRPLISGIANLVLNLSLVKIIGLYGIVLSTILSVTFISAPWITKNVFDKIFKGESKVSFIKDLLFYICATVAATVVVNVACSFIDIGGILEFLIKGAVAVLLSNTILIAAYFKHSLFGESVNLAKRMFLKRR